MRVHENLTAAQTVTVLLAWLAIPATPAAADATYITIDVPRATSTLGVSINAKNDIAGIYDTGGAHHGFIRTQDGTIAKFNPKGSRQTYTQAINDDDEVIGYFVNPNGFTRSFLRTADGIVTRFNVHAALSTWASAINSVGVIAGFYTNDASGFSCHSFIRARDGSTTSFDAPGAVCTEAFGINKQGAVTGAWLDVASNEHGFVRSPDGTLVEFDVPRATFTQPRAVDNSGTIAGGFVDRHGVTHGFLRTRSGKIVRIEPAGATYTFAWDLAYRRGAGSDATGNTQDGSDAGGFLRSADGTIVTFHAPDDRETDPTAINAHDCITGSYIDRRGFTHGFLRLP